MKPSIAIDKLSSSAVTLSCSWAPHPGLLSSSHSAYKRSAGKFYFPWRQLTVRPGRQIGVVLRVSLYEGRQQGIEHHTEQQIREAALTGHTPSKRLALFRLNTRLNVPSFQRRRGLCASVVQDNAEELLTADEGALSYCQAVVALKESEEQVSLLTKLVESLEQRLDTQETAVSTLEGDIAVGRSLMSDDQLQRLQDHVEHLRTQLGAAQSQLNLAESRVSMLEHLVATNEWRAQSAQEASMQLNVDAGNKVADAWEDACKAQEVQAAAQTKAEEAQSHVASLERFSRIKEAEASDAKLVLAISKHRLVTLDSDALSDDRQALQEEVAAAEAVVQAKVEELKELEAQLNESLPKANELQAEYEKELRQLRWLLQNAVCLAREEADAVAQQLGETEERMNSVLSALELLLNPPQEDDGNGDGGGGVGPSEPDGQPPSSGPEGALLPMDIVEARDYVTEATEEFAASMSMSLGSDKVVFGGDALVAQGAGDLVVAADQGGWAMAQMQDMHQEMAGEAGGGGGCVGVAVRRDAGASVMEKPFDVARFLDTLEANRRLAAVQAQIQQEAEDEAIRISKGFRFEDVSDDDTVFPLRGGGGGGEEVTQGVGGSQGGPGSELASTVSTEIDGELPPDVAAVVDELRRENSWTMQQVTGLQLSLTDIDASTPLLSEDLDASAFETVDISDEVNHSAYVDQELEHLKDQLKDGTATLEPPTPETAEQLRPPLSTPSSVPTQQIVLYTGAVALPHPDKRHKGGEDAYFTSNIGHGAIGVADGVGGWIEDGVDPGEYSRSLMSTAEKTLEEQGPGCTPELLMRRAQECTYAAGSSTACIAVMQPGGKLKIVNLGDSGVKIIRNGKVFFKTNVQQHMFNMPYQMAYPELLPDTDTVDDADMYDLQLQEGDVIIMATDGLFDNLWDEQLLDIVRRVLMSRPRTPETAEVIANVLADTSHDNAIDRNFRSPWAVEAAAAGVLPIFDRMFPRGGKLDDCTVVVAFAEMGQPKA